MNADWRPRRLPDRIERLHMIRVGVGHEDGSQFSPLKLRENLFRIGGSIKEHTVTRFRIDKNVNVVIHGTH